MNNRNIFFTVFFLLVFCTINSQSLISKTWFNVSYEKNIKVTKKFKFKANISQGLRISNIVYTPKNTLLTEIGVSKKITKFYKLGVSYRASYLNGLKNRLALTNKFSIKLKPFVLSFRLKYQAEFKSNSAFSQDFREKTVIKWNAHKDYKPYIFGELLFNNTYNYSNFNEYRMGLGLAADHKKKHNFNLGVMFVQDINVEEPRKSFVLSLEYLFSK